MEGNSSEQTLTDVPKRRGYSWIIAAESLIGRNPAFGLCAILLVGVFAGPILNRATDTEEFVVRGEAQAATAYAPVVLAVGGPKAPDWEDAILPPGLYEDGGIFAAVSGPVAQSGSRHSRGITEYVVEQGDTLSEIADAHGVSTATIAWANTHLKNFDFLRPGDILRIPSSSGVLHVVKKGETLAALAKKYNTNSDEVIRFNALPADGSLTQGDEILFVGGEVPPTPAPPRPQYVGGGKSFAQAPVAQGYYGLPVPRGYHRMRGVTSWHRGVDLAMPCGNPIYASAPGTVVRADFGWNGGFGNVVVVAHSNGTETLYAHLLAIFVQKGQEVGQGNVIAQMGGSRALQGAQAGRSTGCHLHFEVHGAGNPF